MFLLNKFIQRDKPAQVYFDLLRLILNFSLFFLTLAEIGVIVFKAIG